MKNRTFYITTTLFIIIIFIVYLSSFKTDKNNSDIDISKTETTVNTITNVIKKDSSNKIIDNKLVQTKEQNKQSEKHKQSNKKVYVNKKLGFEFTYPNRFIQNEKETKIVDRTGKTTEIQLNLLDSSSQTSLLLRFHIGDNGIKLFKYKKTQFNSSSGKYKNNAQKTSISGTEAIIANNTVKYNGKGQLLDTPKKIILIDFLSSQAKGEIEIQYKFLEKNNETETKTIKNILSSFKFIKSTQEIL